MKKTLIALVALAGGVSGVEQYDSLYMGDSLTNTITFASPYTASSVAFTIDVDQFKACMGGTWNAGVQASVTSLMKMTGTWNDDAATTGFVGININGSSGKKYGTLYGQYEVGTDKKDTALKLDGLSEQTDAKFTTDFAWDNYESMSIVLTHQEGALTAYYMAKTSDGSLEKLTGTAALTYAKDSITYNCLTITGLDLTGRSAYPGIVTAVAVYDSVLSATDAAVVGEMMLNPQSIPEPATATLSLMALCGLAARRRRK